MHDPFEYTKREYDAAGWVATARPIGLIDIGKVKMNVCPWGFASDYGDKEISGQNVITDATAQIRLNFISNDLYSRKGTYILTRHESLPSKADIGAMDCR